MTKFVAKLGDDSHINIPADEIEITDKEVIAWKEDRPVAYINKDFCLCAHISDNDKK